MNRNRLQTTSDLNVLLNGVVAPFLISYVNWVLGEAKKKAISRLYFVARDGQILYRLSQVLATDSDSPELRYLYGSRRAWLLPSITDKELSWRRLVITAAQSNSLNDLCGRLGFAQSQMPVILAAMGISAHEAGCPLAPNHAGAVLDKMLANSEIRAILNENIANSRSLLLSYLQQEGMLDGSTWALVDAGWSLNCQAALKRALAEWQEGSIEPRGFYMGLARDYLPPDVAGKAFPMLATPGSIISRRRVVLEHCFMPATHSSTKGYHREDGRIYPVFSVDVRSSLEIEYAHQLQNEVLSCGRKVLSDPVFLNDFDAYKVRAINAVQRFVRNPGKSEVENLNAFQVIADLRHESSHTIPLCTPLSWTDMAKIMITAISRRWAYRQPVSLWLEGAAAISSPAIRLFLRTMLNVDALRHRLRRR